MKESVTTVAHWCVFNRFLTTTGWSSRPYRNKLYQTLQVGSVHCLFICLLKKQKNNLIQYFNNTFCYVSSRISCGKCHCCQNVPSLHIIDAFTALSVLLPLLQTPVGCSSSCHRHRQQPLHIHRRGQRVRSASCDCRTEEGHTWKETDG